MQTTKYQILRKKAQDLGYRSVGEATSNLGLENFIKASLEDKDNYKKAPKAKINLDESYLKSRFIIDESYLKSRFIIDESYILY